MSNYKPQEFAEMIGVSVKTLQRWDKDCLLYTSGFQTSIENLSATLINGDLVKFGITSGTQIIDVLDNLISKLDVYKRQDLCVVVR